MITKLYKIKHHILYSFSYVFNVLRDKHKYNINNEELFKLFLKIMITQYIEKVIVKTQNIFLLNNIFD